MPRRYRSRPAPPVECQGENPDFSESALSVINCDIDCDLQNGRRGSFHLERRPASAQKRICRPTLNDWAQKNSSLKRNAGAVAPFVVPKFGLPGTCPGLMLRSI